MIRKGRYEDITRILELANKAGDLTPYSQVPRDRQSMVQVVTSCMASRFSCCFVAEHEGILTGVLLAQAPELWFSKKRAATDLLFYSERADGAGLIREYLQWAWSVPQVIEVSLAQSSGLDMDRFEKLCAYAGLQRMGSVYGLVKPPKAAEVAT